MTRAELAAWEFGRTIAQATMAAAGLPAAIDASTDSPLSDDLAAARDRLGPPAWRYWVARGAYEWEHEHRHTF